MNRVQLSKRFKKARLEAGLKQKDLAKCLGIPVSAVSLLESGKRGVDVLELLLIADLFQKQPEWFYFEDIPEDRRRWSDRDSVIYDAMNMFKTAPGNVQKAMASAMIAFFKSYSAKKK